MIGLLLLRITMKLYLNSTANLGDFLQVLPVLSGIVKTHGKIEFFIKREMRKFKGIKEFLNYQDLFDYVYFDDEVFMSNVKLISSWTREDKSDSNRPTETCRYENWMRDYYKLDFEVDDDFIVKTPNFDLEVEDGYYVGDRWSVGDIDNRRETHVLSNLEHLNLNFLDYNNSLLINAYTIKNLKKPFITNFTGVGMLADLCNVPLYCVWKAEDWKPEYRRGDDISWDNGKNIQQIYEKHFYQNRKSKLVHANNLLNLIK